MTSIEWTDVTWNPVRGCSRVSEGCRNCYAERIAVRMSGPGQWGEGFADVPRRHSETGAATTGVRGHWTGKVALVPEKLDEPLRWRKPRRVFVNSMSDLFHEKLDVVAIAWVFAVMADCPRHTFQVLTKRPEVMRGLMNGLPFRQIVSQWLKGNLKRRVVDLPVGPYATWPLPNVWLGVSVEDQATADERIPLLLQTPAAKRFVSYEPALGPVDFEKYLAGWCHGCQTCALRRDHRLGKSLDWIIVGGESGPGARTFEIEWARGTVRQCQAASVAVFVKQLGSRPAYASGYAPRLDSSKGGDPSEWPSDLRVREFPA